MCSGYMATIVDVAGVCYLCLVAGQVCFLDFCFVGDGQRAGLSGVFEVDRDQTLIFAIAIFLTVARPFFDLYLLGDVSAGFGCYLDRTKIDLLCLIALIALGIP